MVRTALVIAVSAVAMVLGSDLAWARHGGCGGRHHRHGGGCESSCGSGESSCGGCESSCGSHECAPVSCESGCGSHQGCAPAGCGGHGYQHHGQHGCGGCASAAEWSAPGCATCSASLENADSSMEMASASEAPVTLIVNLPDDAKLTVNGQATVSTSASRVFTSPAIARDKEYTYTLQATVTRDGKTQSMTREITVRAGDETRVNLEMPGVAVASR